MLWFQLIASHVLYLTYGSVGKSVGPVSCGKSRFDPWHDVFFYLNNSTEQRNREWQYGNNKDVYPGLKSYLPNPRSPHLRRLKLGQNSEILVYVNNFLLKAHCCQKFTYLFRLIPCFVKFLFYEYRISCTILVLTLDMACGDGQNKKKY